MADPEGDSERFDQNWRHTREAHYLHWTRGEPNNQIQLAFRQHWLTFQELIGTSLPGRRCLEVGCGRGSLSAYFSDGGWDCTLIDLSPAAIDVAKSAFAAHGLKAKFDVGNCLSLPYREASFDLVFSIGLLEHFQDVDRVIDEQVRVLVPGGMFIGYVVPHMPDNVQKDYAWICQVLKALGPPHAAAPKTEVFRSDAMSPGYLASMGRAGLKNVGASGAYPLPMISHSIEFPFSLLPPEAERVVVEHFTAMLDQRRAASYGKNPWLCREGHGQAFLVWGQKL